MGIPLSGLQGGDCDFKGVKSAQVFLCLLGDRDKLISTLKGISKLAKCEKQSQQQQK